MATEIKNNPKQKEGYAEFRKNVSKGLKLQLPVTAKQEIKELEKMADTIERLRKKMADLDRTRGQITSTIAEIERAIDKNYIPMEKVGPRGERFYYIKLMEEDSKYHVMVLDRAKLLLKRLEIDDGIDNISKDMRNTIRKALALQMKTEKKYNAVTSYMDKNLEHVAKKYKVPSTAKKRKPRKKPVKKAKKPKKFLKRIVKRVTKRKK